MFARVVIVGCLSTIAVPARATWSIVAVDPVTREVGVAVATCVAEPNGSRILPQVAGVAPGIGALAAQAQFNQQTRDRALSLLRAGSAPDAIIADVVGSDLGASSRQYGVVTLKSGSSNYTGSSNSPWAGAVESSVASVQGNILVGADVVREALRAFEQTEPCEDALADKLLRALAAGARSGGDSRCPMDQGALVAVLRVAAPGDDADNPPLNLLVKSPRGAESPVALLQRAYQSYREEHPSTACQGLGDGGSKAPASDLDGGRRDAEAGGQTRDGGADAGGVYDAAVGPRELRDAAVAVREAGANTRDASGPGASAGSNALDASVDDAGERGEPAANDDEDEDEDGAPRERADDGCALGGRRSAGASLIAMLAPLGLLALWLRRSRSSRDAGDG